MTDTEIDTTQVIAQQAARRELDLQEARWQRQRASQLFHGEEPWTDLEREVED
jgi:hypothetical protein